MYDDIDKAAQESADTFKNSLQYLVDAQNQQRLLDQQAATQRYQNLLEQINQQRNPLQQQFATDTQAAYINKMLAGKQVNQNLSQLGLNTSGFGVGQQLQNETTYGQNVNQLILGRNQGLQNIANQEVNATGQYGAEQTQLESAYAGRLAELNKYITEATQNQYNTVYNQMTDAKKYQDSLAQLALDNAFREKQFKEQKRQAGKANSGGSGGTSFDDTKPKSKTKTINVTTDYFNGQMPQATFNDLQKGAFGTKDKNGVQYQPNNIKGVYFEGSVGKAGTVTGNKNIKNTSDVNVANQNVWKLPDGTLWIWNGTKMKYEQIKQTKSKSGSR
jgi:hypothetical protein